MGDPKRQSEEMEFDSEYVTVLRENLIAIRNKCLNVPPTIDIGDAVVLSHTIAFLAWILKDDPEDERPDDNDLVEIDPENLLLPCDGNLPSLGHGGFFLRVRALVSIESRHPDQPMFYRQLIFRFLRCRDCPLHQGNDKTGRRCLGTSTRGHAIRESFGCVRDGDFPKWCPLPTMPISDLLELLKERAQLVRCCQKARRQSRIAKREEEENPW